jgi:hypothetical protein
LKLRGEQPIGSSFLPSRNVIFVVDDDPGMLMSEAAASRKWIRQRAVFLSERI